MHPAQPASMIPPGTVPRSSSSVCAPSKTTLSAFFHRSRHPSRMPRRIWLTCESAMHHDHTVIRVCSRASRGHTILACIRSASTYHTAPWFEVSRHIHPSIHPSPVLGRAKPDYVRQPLCLRCSFPLRDIAVLCIHLVFAYRVATACYGAVILFLRGERFPRTAGP